MSMRVLFLALGATRSRAAIADSARVTSAGGQAVLMIDSDTRWANEVMPEGVELVRHADVRVRRVPSTLEWLLLFWLPRKAFRLSGGRGERAYFRRRAQRVQRRSKLFDAVPLLRSRRLWPSRIKHDVQDLVLRFGALKGEVFDLMVVCDPASMPVALTLLQPPAVAGSVAFSLDSAVPAQRAGQAPVSSGTR